ENTILDKKTKLTEAQIRAQKKYDEKHREQRNYTKQRSTDRTFIRKAEKEDLEELKEMIQTRLNYLN
ncbi:hypothetical protein, partial [Atopococcus tabaci]|uniref:hypothetical protein n=1 Tax=Atopococcus tabaci TaxID=269774 RepID=UPI002409E64C